MNNITEPLQLAVGSHQPGSGKGCAMNVISWENGDTVITDLPQCTEPVLAAVIHAINDTYCIHNGAEDTGLLCPACSVQVLALAHRTVGTKLIKGASPVVTKGGSTWTKICTGGSLSCRRLFPSRYEAHGSVGSISTLSKSRTRCAGAAASPSPT